MVLKGGESETASRIGERVAREARRGFTLVILKICTITSVVNLKQSINQNPCPNEFQLKPFINLLRK